MKTCRNFFLPLILAGSLHAGESRPNVLFLAVDDMNDWIGCLAGTLPAEGPRAIAPPPTRDDARCPDVGVEKAIA